MTFFAKTKRAFLFSLVFTLVLSVAIQVFYKPAISAVYVWTQQTGSGDRNWYSASSSSDGTQLVVGDYGTFGDTGYIYTSTDSGANWTERSAVGSRDWEGLTMSADGTRIAAVEFGSFGGNGSILVSSNSGANWTEHVFSENWRDVAGSSDGQYLVAVGDNGAVYVSSDFGANWTSKSVGGGGESWQAAAVESVGQYMWIGGQGTNLFYSMDFGSSWSEDSSSGNRDWKALAIGGTTELYAAANSDYIYKGLATGSGSYTQLSNSGSRSWSSVATDSSTGQEVVASDYFGNIYTSEDGGSSWTTQADPGTSGWQAVAMSSDGTKIIAVADSSSYVYTAGPDLVAPVVTEVTPVTDPTNDTTPAYTFNTDEAGTISYGGSCSSGTTSASVGNNTISFNTLTEGTYNDCTITVTDVSSNASTPLSVTAFTIDTTLPTITNVTSDKANGTYGVAEVIDIDVTFSENVTSALVTVTLETGAVDRTCTFSVSGASTGTCNYTVQNGDNSADLEVSAISGIITDASGNAVANFTPTTNLAANKDLVISTDAAAPTLSETTPVSTPTADTTPDYTFTTDEAGTISYGGSCSSGTTTAVLGANTITFNALAEGMYSDCTITVTDAALNASTPLSVTAFTIDTTAPILAQVSTIGSTFDRTPSYSFSSDEAGSITYSGVCSSLASTATAGTNTIAFNDLDYGTYNGCTITVTDQALNASLPLSVASFSVNARGSVPVSFLQNQQTQTEPEQEEQPELDKEIPGCENKSYFYSPITGHKCPDREQPTCPLVPATPNILRIGMTDPTIQTLQESLNCKGFAVAAEGPGSKGNETSFFGRLTRQAVQNIQAAFNLVVDGIVGPQTRGVLNQ